MIMSNKDIEEYHNIGLDTATKVFNKFKDGSLDYLELDLNFNDYKVKTEFNNIEPYYVNTGKMKHIKVGKVVVCMD